MENIQILMKRARNDVDISFKIWTEILEEKFAGKINYSYAKGSAVKDWDSAIDYVPILSDIDIHLSVNDVDSFLGSNYEAVELGLELPKLYEERYVEQNPDHLHIPRTQIMLIEQLKNFVDYVIPDYNSVKFIKGSKSMLGSFKIPTTREIRGIDKKKILDEKSYIDKIPFSVLDRTGLDQWQFMRQMSWRISPMPVRLLSQIVEAPFYLWNENRTNLVKLLKENNFNSIANYYENYYNIGWKLFSNNFDDAELFRELVRNGHSVLLECYNEVQNLENLD